MPGFRRSKSQVHEAERLRQRYVWRLLPVRLSILSCKSVLVFSFVSLHELICFLKEPIVTAKRNGYVELVNVFHQSQKPRGEQGRRPGDLCDYHSNINSVDPEEAQLVTFPGIRRERLQRCRTTLELWDAV